MPERQTAPALHTIDVRPLPDATQVPLGCGNTANVQASPDNELVKMTLVIPGGKCEMGRVESVAGLNMLKEGTRSHNGEQLAEMLDFNGAEFSCGASDHYGLVSVRGLRRNFDKVLPLVFEMLAEPVYPEAALDACRRSLATQLQVQLSTAVYNATLNAQRQMAGSDHPLGQAPSLERILGISAAGLEALRTRWLNPRDFGIYVCGAVDDAVLRLIDDGMGALPRLSTGNPIAFTPMKPCGPCRDNIELPDSLQHSLQAWLPAPDISSPDYRALRVAVQALGGYFGSRLMQNIREDKGYTYGISAALNWRPELSAVQIACECDARYIDGVIAELHAELDGMADHLLSDDEFRRVMLNLSSWLATMGDTTESVQGRHVTLATSCMPADYYEQLRQGLPTVTVEDIARVSARYFRPGELRLSIAGRF